MYQFYQLKIESDMLKEFHWEINTTFNKAKADGLMVKVADNQLFRTIRDIRKKVVNVDDINRLFSQRDKIQEEYGNDSREYKNIQHEINKNMYMSDVITVVIKHVSHYKYLVKNGFYVSNDPLGNKKRKFVRVSCSAGQARKSTVVFCNEEIIDEVLKRLNNDRDISQPISPNKFNAYFGLYTSSTILVKEPKFTVIPDYNNNITFLANWSTETEWEKDDIMEQKEITVEMNRTDGMGIISPDLAKEWSDNLGLNYTCCNFIIRQSFIKGLLTTFDFKKFCKEKNNGNYLVKTIYKDKDGNAIYDDLRNVDVIISESQFKLWNSFKSKSEYVRNCHKNKLMWGVSQFNKESPSEVFTLNYQFIQTLNLSKDSVNEICKPFIDWCESVSYSDAYSAMLYLVGKANKPKKIIDYLNGSSEYWIKALMYEPNVINDRYIKEKINYYTRNKIKKACLGEIICSGNFQYIITDPYAYMQHVCGQEPTGLLGKNEYYSRYWNNKGVAKVDAMRSPMTYRSEHVILDLVKNEDTEEWYKYIDNGIILNWYGNDVVRFSGADELLSRRLVKA